MALISFVWLFFTVPEYVLVTGWVALTCSPPTIKPAKVTLDSRLAQLYVHFIVLLAHPPEATHLVHVLSASRLT